MLSTLQTTNYKLYLIDGMGTTLSVRHEEIFMKTLNLRISGYKKHYGFKVMPVDIYDHFSKQLVLSESTNVGEKLLACVRFISMNDCRKYDAMFLPLARAGMDSKNKNLESAVQKIMDECEHNDLYYNSSLTVSPAVASRKKTKEIIETIIGSALNYHKAIDSKNWLTSAPVKVRTDRLFKKIGYEAFCENPYYLLKTLNNEETIMFRHIHENNTYKEWLSKTKYLWRNVTITP